MCAGCRLERIDRTDFSIEAIRKRHEKHIKYSHGRTANSLIIERGKLLDEIERLNTLLSTSTTVVPPL